MPEREPTYEELKTLLERAESILDALRQQEVDAVIGDESVSMVRLHEVERALRESEAKYRNLAESIDAVVYRIDPVAREVTYVNSAVEPLFGYRVEEWLQDPALPNRVVHPDDREWVFDEFRNARRNREACIIEYRIVRKDGTVRWVENRATWDYAEDGTVLSSNGVVYDITDRKRVEAERRRNEERLRESHRRINEILESITDGFYAVDEDWRLTYVNSRIQELWGRCREELEGEVLWNLFSDYEETRGYREHVRAMEKRVPLHFETFSPNLQFWGDVNIYPTANGGLSVYVRDITERKEAEAALRELTATLEAKVQERTERLKELSVRLTRAEQAERHRIAQLLHDDLQQLLYSVRLSLSTVADGLTQEAYDNEALLQTLAKADERTTEAVKITRRLNVELSPPILEGEGLTETLDWLALQMQQQYKFTVEVDAEGSFHVPDQDLRLLLFQSIRELLFNVVKHAEVAQATVSLYWMDDNLCIQVSDEGAGFDVEQAMSDTPSGWGLATMGERLELVGGRMDVSSQPSEGTWVTLYAPVARKEAGEDK